MATASELWNQAQDQPSEDLSAPAPLSSGAAALLEQSKERTLGGSLREGMMGESTIIPTGFIKSVGTMLAGIPQFLGAGANTMVSPGGEDNTLSEVMLGKVTTAIIKEILRPSGEGTFEETHPVTAEVARILGDEVLYFTDRQKLYEKIATAPAEVLSDIASAVGAVFSGGATAAGTHAPRLAKALQIGAKATEFVDPAMIPSHVARGAARVGGRTMRGPDAEGFDPETEFEIGRDPATGAPMTATTSPVEGAEQFGAGREMTPDAVLNPSPGIETREYLRMGMEGEIGASARRRLDLTEQAIAESKRKMTEDMARGVDPYNAEGAGKYVLDAYQQRQLDDKLDFKQKFQQIRANFTDEVPIGHEWRKNLDAALDELKPTQIDPQELQKVRGVVEDILQDVDTQQLTLNDIDAFRTEFRQRMITQFNKRDVNVIGSGSMTEKVYNAITNDLYDAIEATVRASDGRLPATLLDDVRKAKAQYRDIKVLEDTAGGRFLVRNQDNPAELINALLGRRLATDEIKNVYKLIGEDAAADIQAALMNQIFQTAAQGPLGLQNKIEKINRANPNRLIEMFGGGERGKEIATNIGALGEFQAMLKPIKDRNTGTITGRANYMMSQGGMLSAMTTFFDLSRALVSGDAPYIATVSGAWFGQWAIRAGHTQWVHSDWGRRRLAEGIKDPEMVNAFIKGVDMVTGRAVAKPIELGARVTEGAEDRNLMDSLDELGRFRERPKE